ncbi:MAG: oligosaccharide flippase family protein [Phycisphaerales bacterium]|nr:oligosaccharide flippase family protein [Phycisphaerales bacterium]
MTLRRRVFHGALSLAAGQALGQGLSFLRNVIVARLLSPEDFGVAATFAITVSLFEMLSDLAVDKLIIQARDGDDPRLQATAQAFQSLRGLVCGLLTAALAWPIALLFSTPEAVWAYVLLGLVPVFRGLAHLDVGRLQREMRFGPAVVTQVGSQLAAVLAAWPLARWLGDWSAMLWIVLIQSAVLALLSHLVARRSYSWAWNAVQLRRLLIFGWPLLINGVLMFGVFQGDLAIVGSHYLLAQLAHYSLAGAIAAAPTQVVGSVFVSLLLPLFADVQSDQTRLVQRYRAAIQSACFSAGLIAAGITLLADGLLSGLFGEKYSAAGDVLVLLGFAQAVRLARMPPTVAALARQDTLNSAISNGYRLLGIPVALALASCGAPLSWIALAAIFGECSAFASAVFRLQRRQAVPISASFVPCMLTLTMLAGLLAPRVAFSDSVYPYFGVVDFGIVAAYSATMLRLCVDLRDEIQRFAKKVAIRTKRCAADVLT